MTRGPRPLAPPPEALSGVPRRNQERHRLQGGRSREEVEGDRAKVRITVGSRPNDPNLTKMDPEHETIVQDWIKVKDQWYVDVSG